MKRLKKNEPTFLFDEDGKKSGVLLKIADFEKMIDGLEDYEDYKAIKKHSESKGKYKTYTLEEVMADLYE